MTHQHLNDEQLSAHLDGERPEGLPSASDATWEAEISACDTCRQRRAQLGQARDLVRTPVVPVAPSMRAAAVEAAIADGRAELPVSAPSSGPAPGVVTLPARRPTRRVLSGAAAAVAVLAVAAGVSVGLVHAGSSSTPSAASSASNTRAHGPADLSARTPTASTTARPSATSGATVTSGGVVSLGSVSSPQVLRQRLAPVLASPTFEGKTATTATGAAQDKASSVPANGFGTTNTGVGKPTTCAPAALAAAAPADTEVLVATVTYRNTPALVVVAQGAETSSTASAGRVAIVVARSGCRVLARTTL